MANFNQLAWNGTKPAGWAVIFAVTLAVPVLAAGTSNELFVARAERALGQAQKQFLAGTNHFNSAAAGRLARACANLADLATNNTQRAAIARQGMAVCRNLLAHQTNSAAGHYYLALNDGELAKAEEPSLASYRLVHDMERELKTAVSLDPDLDYAGPERCLGILYRDAPGWPFSIGSRRKARDFLERAVQLAPDYPGNRLSLAESYLRWRNLDRARAELKALDAIWPKAQTNLVGRAWEQNWSDWSARRAALRKKIIPLAAPAKRFQDKH